MFFIHFYSREMTPCAVVTVTKGKVNFFCSIIVGLSIAIGGLSTALIGLVLFLCMKKKKRNLKRKRSDEELNRIGYDPDTFSSGVLPSSEELEDLEDTVHFIRNRRVVDGVKTGFSQEIENIGPAEIREESDTPAVLSV